MVRKRKTMKKKTTKITEREKIARNFGKKPSQNLKSWELNEEIRVLKSVIKRPKEFDWYYRAKWHLQSKKLQQWQW